MQNYNVQCSNSFLNRQEWFGWLPKPTQTKTIGLQQVKPSADYLAQVTSQSVGVGVVLAFALAHGLTLTLTALLPLPLLFCGAANHPGHYRHEHRPFDPPSEVATSPDWPSSRQVPRGVAARDCGYLPIQYPSLCHSNL